MWHSTSIFFGRGGERSKSESYLEIITYSTNCTLRELNQFRTALDEQNGGRPTNPGTISEMYFWLPERKTVSAEWSTTSLSLNLWFGKLLRTFLIIFACFRRKYKNNKLVHAWIGCNWNDSHSIWNVEILICMISPLIN